MSGVLHKIGFASRDTDCCRPALAKHSFKQRLTPEHLGAAGNIRGQPAVFVVGRDFFAQYPPGGIGADAKALELQKLKGLCREQILDSEDLRGVIQHLVQLQRGVGAHAQVVFLQTRGDKIVGHCRLRQLAVFCA